ncbi:MAG: hypothetical protein IKG21_06550 [Atopobiaceae bacterium]|nr:hypothetical protein [Atopobiaceae bacterium]
MGLFERKRSVRALDDASIDAIRRELNSVLGIAQSYDQLMMHADVVPISIEGRIRGDLLAFVLYLAGVNGSVDMREILVVNHIFDIDLSHVDFTIFREDVSDHLFEHAIPPSILMLQELGSTLQREMEASGDATDTNLPAAFAVDLINLYALVGSALISADERITERESADLLRYLYMMCYAAFGENTELPSGPAYRVLAAHKRLFGRVPKV